jgi:hypothetical protein
LAMPGIRHAAATVLNCTPTRHTKANVDMPKFHRARVRAERQAVRDFSDAYERERTERREAAT